MCTGLRFSRYILELTLADGTQVLSNLLWRTFLELSRAEAQAWNEAGGVAANPLALPGSLTDKLAEQKLLLDRDLDEAALITRKYTDSRFSPEVLGFTITPTLDCNFACRYCYETKAPGTMAPEVQAQVIQYVKQQLPGKRNFAVTWYGGEPLLCKDTVLHLSMKFIEISASHGVKYSASLITNGSLLNSSTVDGLAALGHWRHIQVTLDGDGAAHDAKRPGRGGKKTFDGILGHLPYAAEHLPMALRMNVDRINPAACHDLLERLATMGLAERLRVYFAPIHPYGKGCRDIGKQEEIAVASNVQFAEIEMHLLRHALDLGFRTRDVFGGPWLQQCQAVSTHSLIIEPDGSLQRCWVEVGEADKRVGHLSQELELNSAGNMRWLSFDPTRNEPCQGCAVLPLCFGGCPQRHLAGAPEEYRCREIRFNVKDRLILEYLSRHRPGQIAANLGPVRPGAWIPPRDALQAVPMP